MKLPTLHFTNEHRHRGFTMIELLITIAILAILLGLATPSFVGAYKRSQARNLADELMAGFIYARSEAINRSQCVTVCMVNDPSAAAPVCRTTGTDWERGWLVFANPACDDNPNGTNAELLQIYMGVAANRTTATVSNATRAVMFNPRGATTLAGGAAVWSVAPAGENPVSAVCLARTGRVARYSGTTVGSCS